MLAGIQGMWTGFCGAISAGYASASAWSHVVVTTAGNGLAEVGKKMIGM